MCLLAHVPLELTLFLFSHSFHPLYIFRQQISLWEALKTEFLFAINFSIVTKPVHNRLTEEDEAASESPKSASRSRVRSICFEDQQMLGLSVNPNNGCGDDETAAGGGSTSQFGRLASRSLSGISRIGNLFAKKTTA